MCSYHSDASWLLDLCRSRITLPDPARLTTCLDLLLADPDVEVLCVCGVGGWVGGCG